jgi:hypothetical protein
MPSRKRIYDALARAHVLDRAQATHKVIKFAEALGGEGFTDDDVTDALLRAACSVGNKG